MRIVNIFTNLSSAYSEYSNCEIVAIEAKYDFKPYGWGFQKDSPFLDIFNYYLDEMREKGAMKQIFKKHEPQPQVTTSWCPEVRV